MKDRDKGIQRRDFLRRVTAGVGLAVGASGLPRTAPAADEPVTGDKKRRARYQADSAEVKDFYRVNRYPPGPRGSSC